MKLALVFTLAALLAFAASTPTPAGKWAGNVDMKTPDGQEISVPMTGDFQCTDGKAVTGTVTAGDSPDIAISNGAFNGENLTFTVTNDEGIVYELKFTFDGADKMNGTAAFTGQDGTKMTAKIVLNRQKTT